MGVDIGTLAQHAATLLRAADGKDPRPQAVDIAQAAASLLGLPARAPAARMSAFARQRSAAPVDPPHGIMTRLRKLFDKP